MNDIEKKAAYNKDWVKSNPDKVKGYNSEWKKRNPDKIKAYNKKALNKRRLMKWIEHLNNWKKAKMHNEAVRDLMTDALIECMK